jgi:hypothetical protein
MRRLALLILCTLLTATASLALGLALAAPAAAAPLCEEGEAAGQCEEPQGLAVDLGTERLYLADKGNDRVDVFDAEDNFLFSFGAGELDAPRSVAVDNDPLSPSRHDVYVADFGNRRIVKYDDEGNFLAAFGAGEYDEEGPESTDGMLVATGPDLDAPIEADSELYVADVRRTPWDPTGSTPAEKCPLPALEAGDPGAVEEKCLTTRLRRYEPGGGAPAFERDVVSVPREGATGGNLGGLAVDSEGNSYIRNTLTPPGEGLCKYDAAGERIPGFREAGCFPVKEAEGVKALAVDEADRLFAGGIDRDQGGSPYRVIAEYDAAGSPLRRFGYGELSGFVEGLAAQPGGAGPVYASLSGGEALTLPFPSGGPIAVSPEAEGITSFKADIHAELNPEGKDTEYVFQYLTQADYEAQGESFEGPATRETEAGEIPIEAGTPEEEEAHFRLNRAEATIGCPDPETEAEEAESPCLAPETAYRWRIVATNEDGGGEGTLEGEPFTTTEPLEILAVWPTAVGVDAATLNAELNPFGAPASGYFEYLTEAEYQANLAAEADPFAGAAQAPDVTHGAEPLRFGSGEAPAARSATAFPLKQGTAYRFRLLATNSLIDEPIAGAEHRALATLAPSPPAPCPAEGLRGGLPGARTGAAAYLPDCRAYELVSPLDKNNADIFYIRDSSEHLPSTLEQSSTDGDRMAYTALTAFAEPAGAPYVSQYLAARHAGREWQTHDVSSPRERLLTKGLAQVDTEFEAFSPDLCQGWLRTVSDPPLAAGAIEGALNLYRRTDEDCGGPSYEAITTIAPPDVSGAQYVLELQGASADGRRAIFRTNDTLPGSGAPPEPPECAENPVSKCRSRLYLKGAGEATRYPCVFPSGAKAGSCGAGSATDAIIAQRLRNGSFANALSADGEKVFWSAPAPGEGRIYVRENPYEPEGPRAHGAATGHGDAIGPARGSGRILKNQTEAVGVRLEDGGFLAGQEVEDSAGVLPEATKIVEVELEREEETGSLTIYYYKLSFDRAATGYGLSDTFTGLPSATLANVTADTGAFEAGQAIEGAGIPAGTTVESCSPECGEAATSLTLSQVATETSEAASLEATSPCLRPLSGACTTPVSKAAEEAQETTSSRFWGAAADGSRAIFTTGAPGGAAEAALYSYDVASEAGHRIAGEVYGVAGTDADASRVYFASAEALEGEGVEEENGEGEEAIAGEPNLYLYEAGEAGGEGHYAFIATLAGHDVVNGKVNIGPVAARPVARLARVTPGGGALAFMSAAPLTGFDNTDAERGEPDMEVFLYDAASGRLVCASCNPTGARPLGTNANRDFENAPLWAAAAIPNWENPLYASRALSQNGRRLFFTTRDKLVARDTNGRQDVYQWEAPGEGTCTTSSPTYSPPNGGCLDLISSGQADRDVEFRDASPSGEDVFFTTGASLLPQDPAHVDVYDARAGGGLPLPPEPQPGCEGEACQSPPPAPQAKTPASAAFRGPGNVREAANPFARCNKAGRRARAFSKRARRLRRGAEAAAERRRVRAARKRARKAKRLGKRARKLSARARRCRRAARRAGR